MGVRADPPALGTALSQSLIGLIVDAGGGENAEVASARGSWQTPQPGCHRVLISFFLMT